MIMLGEHFRHSDRNRDSELRRKRWFIKAREDRERRETVEERFDEGLTGFAVATVMASRIELQRFEAKLDAYDEAIVKALMENQEKLDAVNARLEDMLERAYVMPDGRRVFKTADGTQVFDEFGKLVTRDELDYDLIGPDRPIWDRFNPLREKRGLLEVERQRIFEFQERVQAARDRVAEGEIPKSELDGLDADLASAIPPSVRAQLPGHDAVASAPDLKTEFRSPAGSIVLDRATPGYEPQLHR